MKTTERKVVHLQPMKDHSGENVTVKCPSAEEKAAETILDETDQILHCPSPCDLQRFEVEKMEAKLNPERREGWEEGALRI